MQQVHILVLYVRNRWIDLNNHTTPSLRHVEEMFWDGKSSGLTALVRRSFLKNKAEE